MGNLWCKNELKILIEKLFPTVIGAVIRSDKSVYPQ